MSTKIYEIFYFIDRIDKIFEYFIVLKGKKKSKYDGKKINYEMMKILLVVTICQFVTF